MFDRQISRFALACVTINCILIKLFIGAPSTMIKGADSGAITALWLSAAVAAIIIYAVYRLRAVILSRTAGTAVKKILFCIAAAYFACVAIYFLYETVNVIHVSVYHVMPPLLLVIVLSAAILYIGTRNAFSISRLHGLCVPVIILGITAVALSGIKYADPLNAAPLLADGISSVITAALRHLVTFSEVSVPVLLLLLTNSKERRPNSARTVLISAYAGIIIYSSVLTVFFLTIPENAFSDMLLPLDYLSKFSAVGRLGVRTDALYALVLTASGILFMSTAVYLAAACLKRIGLTKRSYAKITAIILLPLLSVVTLCGCYDSREVEDTAFAIAVGIDHSDSEDKEYAFTFQFSNPLATGSNTNIDSAQGAASDSGGSDSGSSDSGGSDTEKGEKNETVDNVKIEANSIFEALNAVNNYIGKTPSLAHVKLIVFPEELVGSGAAMQLCSDLMKAEDMRPEAAVCAVRDMSAVEYLISVKPSLEDSTARHYELMFNEGSAFDSINTDLRTFSFRLRDDLNDAYIPIVTKVGFDGTLLFSGEKAARSISPEDSRLINLLLGKIKNATLYYTADDGRIYKLRQSRRAEIITDNTDEPTAEIKTAITAEPVNNDFDPDTLYSSLTSDYAAVLDTICSANSDILKIRRTALLTNPVPRNTKTPPVGEYRITPDISLYLSEEIR